MSPSVFLGFVTLCVVLNCVSSCAGCSYFRLGFLFGKSRLILAPPFCFQCSQVRFMERLFYTGNSQVAWFHLCYRQCQAAQLHQNSY